MLKLRNAVFLPLAIALLGTATGRASQTIYPDSGGNFTVGSSIGQAIKLASAPISGGGSVSFNCIISSTTTSETLQIWGCSSGSLNLTSGDGSVVSATFSTGTLSFAGSSINGYAYQFNGAFTGTLTKSGIVSSISGATSQYLTGLENQLGPSGAPVTGGTTGVNSLLGPLYIADFDKARIVRTDDLFGTDLTAYQGPENTSERFYGPTGITTDSTYRIYVTDAIACRLTRLDDMTGTGLVEFGNCGSGKYQFSSPSGVAIDSSGRIYIADSGNNRIVRMDDMTGKNWITLGALGSGLFQFSNPTGIAVDNSGEIYVSDSANGRIVRTDITGTDWLALSHGSEANQTFTRPSGIALDSSGRVYVSDSGLLIRVDSLAGNGWSSFLTGDTTNAVSVDPSGTIYLTGSAITRVDNLAGAGWTSSGIVSNAQGIHAVELAPIGSLAVSPASLTFAKQAVGTTSASQAVTLTNTGTAALDLTSFTATESFLVQDDCPASLQAGATCKAYVTFAPEMVETYSGELTILSNGQNPKVVLSLTGVSYQDPPVIRVTPASLTFSLQSIDTLSPAQTVTVTNTGGSALDLTLSITSGFVQKSTCAATLARGKSCTVSVQFDPQYAGAQSGALILANNSATPTVSVKLTGTGRSLPGKLSVTPSSLSFPAESVNVTSPAQTVTVKNIGGSTLDLIGFAITGAFSESTNCGTSLAAGASCTVRITYTPTSSAPTQGTLIVSATGAVAQGVVTLTGAGAIKPAAIQLTPSPLTFPSQIVSTSSAARALTVTNTGGQPLAIGKVQTTGPFTATSHCAASLAASASCTISVVFHPLQAGAKTGVLTVSNSSARPTATAALSGTAIVPQTGISLAPTALVFPGQSLNTTSAAQTVTISNTGLGSLALTGFSVTGPFTEQTTCPSSLGPAGTCTVSVFFTPTATGSATGTLTVANSSSQPAATVALSGTGAAAAATSLIPTPASLAFSAQTVGTTSAASTVVIANPTDAALAITGVTISGPFAQKNNCPGSLAANTSCKIQVTFTPTATGNFTGLLTVSSTTSSAGASVPLSGTASSSQQGVLHFSVASIAFGSQVVGTRSVSHVVTMTNEGTGQLNLWSISVTSGFAQTNNCGTGLAAGTSCTVNVYFTPSSGGAVTGQLQVSNDSGTPQAVVNLSGTGTVPTAILAPYSLSFPSQMVNTQSGPQSLLLANSGNGALTVTSVTTTGPFLAQSNCGTTVPAGGNCIIAVIFNPGAPGAQSGTLIITDNNAGYPASQTVQLSGTATADQPAYRISPGGLLFLPQAVGTASPSQNIVILNNQTVPLPVSSISINGLDFTQTNNCAGSIAAGSTCQVTVTFTPTTTGTRLGTANLSVGSGSGFAVQLTGVGK
jgi:hypothetical protein